MRLTDQLLTNSGQNGTFLRCVPKIKPSQVLVLQGFPETAGEGIRTLDVQLGKLDVHF